MSFIIWAWFVEFNDCGNNIGLMDRGRTAEISYAIRKLFSITSSGDNRKLIAAYLRVSRRWIHGSVFWDRPFHRKTDCSCSLTGRQVTRAGMPDLKMTRLLSKSVMGLMLDNNSSRTGRQHHFAEKKRQFATSNFFKCALIRLMALGRIWFDWI
jgi:hypothetical protein